ncbi:BTAD domain-containing putative transcriptional regulator [Deinococcus pimensis]|uniref:BTAD domain-containing putative transcriptional regulator n=1 Tax=Deinococcus pimensis TaxID=309888 RepID=UPI0004AEE7DD|nr:BTAD domain-containing putative transcriptional regulator [Deinococcus pimensis]
MKSASWRVQLLGPPLLSGPLGQEGRPERKLAALLAYLALEGATSRSRLAGLLWPDSPEPTARNNLSQLLRKLRLLVGTDLIVGADLLDLTEEVTVDLTTAREHVARGRTADLLALSGDFLAGLRYDDLPDLDDWINAERERLTEWRGLALRAEIDRLERSGEYSRALPHARALLDLDPISEDAWRRLMRLHYLAGDRPAALRAYHRCKEVLRRELRTEPLPETVALAQNIDRGSVPVTPTARTVLPLEVLRPPHLVGREREWARLEAAWAAGQWIFISGEPGSGKTRLALDFAGSKGGYIVYAGRPGDRVQPWATLSRMTRINTARRPELTQQLDPWVLREESRLVPELLPPEERPAPITNDEDLLRFREAHMIWTIKVHEGLLSNICDDWQFFDDHTNQMGMYMFGTSFPLGQPGGMPRLLATFRRGELPPEAEALVRQTVELGIAVLIDLEPMEDRAADQLMTDVGVPADPTLRARLWRHCAGNPHFLLETVKLLLEAGQLHGTPPEQLPLPEKLSTLIGRRLERLSPPALQTARAAAVLQSDFDPEGVAGMLGASLLDIARAWEELEAAQVLSGHRFTHDLVYEAVHAGIPASVRGLLHRAAARTLEDRDGHAARVARHWLDGGKPDLAARAYLRAAREARDQYLLGDAARFYLLAADLLEGEGDTRGAAEAREAFEVVTSPGVPPAR